MIIYTSIKSEQKKIISIKQVFHKLTVYDLLSLEKYIIFPSSLVCTLTEVGNHKQQIRTMNKVLSMTWNHDTSTWLKVNYNDSKK